MKNGQKYVLPIILLYVLACIPVMSYSVWYVNNPDTFQYIAIARKYLSADFSHAVNGYWSPMLSWLLILPLTIITDSILALKILQLLIGLVTVFAWCRLVMKSNLSGFFCLSVMLIAVPFIVDYAILNPTADLLFLTLILALINQFVDQKWMQTKRSAIITGMTGAMLYFTKAFGFPLFLVLIFFVGIYKMKLLSISFAKMQIGLSLLVFFLISGSWISILSSHYHSFTISKAASFNMSREVAPLPGVVMKLPVLTEGLLVPPDSNAASAWESPGDAVRLTYLHPFSSSSDFQYCLQVIKRNILTIYYFDFRRQVGIIFLVIFLLSIFLISVKKIFQNQLTFVLILALVAVYGGYSLILVHTRYIWINTWLMILLSGILLQELSNRKWKSNVGMILMVFISMLAIKRPIKEILFSEDKDVSLFTLWKGISHPLQTMEITYKSDVQIHAVATSLRNSGMLNGNVASLRNDSPWRHCYSSSVYLTLYSGSHYFGQLSNYASCEEQLLQLKKSQIDYLLVWEGEQWPCLENEKRVPNFEWPELGLSIYKTN